MPTSRESRPRIPASVARQLRQEAGFGCCRCGLPIIQYHHIVAFRADDPYPPDEMMVLCPLCHDAATKGALPESDQWDYKRSPYNIERELVDGSLAINQDYCAVAIGSTLLVGERPFVKINGEKLLSISVDGAGHLQVSLTIYDERDELIAVIEQNEWVSGDPLPWDIEADFQYLRLRRKLRDIAFEIDARNEPVRLRATLWRGGEKVSLGPRTISIGASEPSGIASLGLVGLGIELDDSGTHLTPDERLPGGRFVSQPTDEGRLKESLKAWESLKADAASGLGRNDPCWCGSGNKFKRCHGR